MVLNSVVFFPAPPMPSAASQPDQRPSPIILWLPIVFWALAFPFIKIGLRELSPVNLTIMRLFSVCAIFLLIRVVAPKRFSPLQKRDFLSLFLLGFFGVVVYHLGLNYGETLMSASAASLIIATIPLFMVVFSVLFLKEKITKRIMMGILISALGVVIIALVGTNSDPLSVSYLFAAIAVLLAAVVGAVYTVAGKKLLERYNGFSLTIYAFLFGSIGLLPLLAVSPSLATEVVAMSWESWAAVLFLAVFPTVIGYIFWYVALEKISAARIGVYLYFIPVLSTIASYFMFDEAITWLFIVGTAFVLGGLVILNRPETS